ncbi:hypothetical protein CRYUN_Cryun02cG0044700 [Craigia yunnanensis]
MYTTGYLLQSVQSLLAKRASYFAVSFNQELSLPSSLYLGGLGRDESGGGENGTVTGKVCPKGLYGTFCVECPVGTYKNVSGSDSSLCHPCPASELPHRAIYIAVRGGIPETPCPYKCISDRYQMPHCYTALEELIYTFGGLVLETNRVEESQSHVYRMYFMDPNSLSEPWHLPHTPPEEIKEIVYEGAYNTFVDEINAIAAYQWWEGAIDTILSILVYPLAWSWQQWRQRMRLQCLREFVRSESGHACLRSCHSRAL